MKIIRHFILFFVVSLSVSSWSYSREIGIKDVQSIMKRFFRYHVDYKEITPEITKRTVYIYIEQFDPERIYLTDQEVENLIQLSAPEIRNISFSMSRGDYSHFYQLDQVFQKAIIRCREIRWPIESNKVNNNVVNYHSKALSANIAKKLEKFFAFHEKRMQSNTMANREKIAILLEKKLHRHENVFFNNDDHHKAVRILKAFAKSLDAHTTFFSEEEAMEMRMSLEKQFEGIGVVLVEGVDGIIVNNIIKNSPADKDEEIRVNDVILEINGKSIQNVPFEEMLKEMKRNKKVELGLVRIQEEDQIIDQPQFYVTLEAAPITIDEERLSYSYEQDGDGIIGKLVLKTFYENSTGVTAERDIRKAIRDMQKQGQLKGLILDLRENAGGFLSQAVKVAGIFISNGVVVVSKYANGDMRYLRSMATQQTYDGPLIILTSKLSASASEIVAQALQDYGVAIIVGDKRTFGKGSLQYQTVTDAHADVFFKVTIGKYYTVSGRSPQLTGVKADIVVPTIFAPYSFGEKYLDNPLASDNIESSYEDTFLDVDFSSKQWLEKYYLPNIQTRISTWQEILPQLKENSESRIENHADYQNFFRKMQNYKAQRIPIGDMQFTESGQDLPMQEALNILKDMIHLRTQEAA